MRFLVDECSGPALARWLAGQGHDVFSVFELARGLDDDSIIQKAYTEERILVTNDKDFGEKVFRDRQAHRGVILLRLDDERTQSKISALQRVLATYADQLEENFVVVTENKVRISRG